MADMFTPGALSTVSPDPAEDEDTLDYGPLSALQSQLAVSRNAALEARKKSWDMVAQRLEKSRPSKAEMWFSLANAFGQPTQTGSFGETLGNVAGALGKSAASKREYETQVADKMLEREQDLADLQSKYDLKGYDLQAKMAASKKRKTGFDPVTGSLKDMDTGEIIGTPNSAKSSVVTIGDNKYVQDPKGGLKEIEPTVEAAAQRAQAVDTAKEVAKVRLLYPKAKNNAALAIKSIDELLAHPGLSAVVGMPDPTKGNFGFADVPGSPAAGFRTRLEQLKGTAFLEAYTTLKGGGAIANAEGEKAEKAVSRMSTAQSEKEFRQAMLDYKSALAAGLAAMEEIMALSPEPGRSSSAPTARRVAPVAPPKASPASKSSGWTVTEKKGK